MSVRETLIAQSDNVLEATVSEFSSTSNLLLTVRRSTTMSQDTDMDLDPVWQRLHEYCNATLGSFIVEDPGYCGRCEVTEYRLFTYCPGELVDHNCRVGRGLPVHTRTMEEGNANHGYGS